MDGLRLSCLNSKELTFRSELKIKKEKQNIGFGPLEMLHAVLKQKTFGILYAIACKRRRISGCRLSLPKMEPVTGTLPPLKTSLAIDILIFVFFFYHHMKSKVIYNVPFFGKRNLKT